MKWRRRVERK